MEQLLIAKVFRLSIIFVRFFCLWQFDGLRLFLSPLLEIEKRMESFWFVTPCTLQISMNAHLIHTAAAKMHCVQTMAVGFPVNAMKNSLEMEEHAQVSPP